MYIIQALWPDSERHRFAALQASHQQDSRQQASRQTQDAAFAPLTWEEKAWMRTHFGSEFKFLLLYGLSIYKEEDRAEGRAILRALMSHDEDDEYET